METTRPRPALALFVVAVAVGAIVGLVASWRVVPVPPIPNVAVLAVLAVLAELVTLTFLRGSDVAISYPITVAAMVLFGPTTATFIGILGAVFAIGWRQRPATLKVVFNLGEAAVCDLAAAWTYVLLGGPVIALGNPASGELQRTLSQWPQFLVPILAAAVVAVVANVALLVAVISLSDGLPPSTVLRGLGLGMFTVVHLSLAFVGLAIAFVIVSYSWLGLIVFAFPILSARQIFQYYARMQYDYPDTVRILVRSIEAKDEYTRGHSERVADYADRFCQSLRLSGSQTEEIRFAAMLHDLGKMGVRVEVLNKPGRLDAAEYDEMKQHPVLALGIVSKIPGTDRLLPVIRHHHERVDGRGYPDGIAGEAIPLAARLLAVCDTYDAMTSTRPYRPALSADAAAAELRLAATTQLDGELTNAFLEMLEADGGNQEAT
ncbi:MAG: HD domain-containing phosphohydrolase [Actinomycetes bacterium]